MVTLLMVGKNVQLLLEAESANSLYRTLTFHSYSISLYCRRLMGVPLLIRCRARSSSILSSPLKTILSFTARDCCVEDTFVSCFWDVSLPSVDCRDTPAAESAGAAPSSVPVAAVTWAGGTPTPSIAGGGGGGGGGRGNCGMYPGSGGGGGGGIYGMTPGYGATGGIPAAGEGRGSVGGGD